MIGRIVVVDHTRAHDVTPQPPVDYHVTMRDIVLGIATAPIFMFVIMFAVTGADHYFRTPGQRLRWYAGMLAIEVVVVASIVWWFTT